MKIQIIGLGIVGTAQSLLCKTLGHEVLGYDPRLKEHRYCHVNDGHIKDADITFVCTPESIIEEVVQNLVDIENTGLIVIKSTIPIGVTEGITKKFGIHVCHNPEFLREEFHLQDSLNPHMIVIGECCKKHGDMLEELYKPIDTEIIRVDSTSSETIKLALNAHLSTLITFWNEIDEICHKLKLNTKDISNILRFDPRISPYGCNFFGTPYGGKCLPKDMAHIINCFRGQDLNPKLFEACESFNDKLIKKVKAQKKR